MVRIFYDKQGKRTYNAIFSESAVEAIQNALILSITNLQHVKFLKTNTNDSLLNENAMWILSNLLKDLHFAETEPQDNNLENK